MGRILLTDKFCAAAKASRGQRTDYTDAQVPGLRLRVFPSGAKTWSFRYVSARDGSRQRLTLGSYPATTLAAARGRALEAKSILDAGQDPRLALAKDAAGAMLVRDLIDSYVEKHARPNMRSHAELERRLRKNVEPIIGTIKLAEVHRRDIARVVDPVMRRGKPVEACRVFEDTRAMLRWAVARGDLERNPTEGMRKPAEMTPRDRALDNAEIRTVWHELPTALARSPAVQHILKLCLITGQRVGEVCGMARAELDFKSSIWTIPGERTKNAVEHEVPLSPLALAIIREAICAAPANSPFVFPAAKGGMSAKAVAKTLHRALEPDADYPLGRLGVAPFTSHDLRRTMLSGLAALGVSPIVAGAVANHVSVTRGTITLAVYTRHSYAAEKVAAMKLWAERLAAIIEGGAAKVLPLERAG
jgi:integrase